jgi:hypothetical protein
MHFERDLQVKLNTRYRRLYKTDYDVFGRQAAFFRQFILSSPALRAIVENLDRLEPDLDPAQWVSEKFTWQEYDWPESEAGRAKVVWYLLGGWADGTLRPIDVAHSFSSGGNVNASLREMTEQTVEPFVEYLEEHLGSESEMLHLLERFKRRVEAFDQDELWTAYNADTKKGEAVYDRHLRKFLFDQGVDYPFSQPASASGKADVVGEIHTDDPLVCEVKLYDGDNYGVPYVAKGLTQAVAYAHDYGKTVAHLVVFNLADHGLQIPSDDDAKAWPPRLHVSGVTVYVVVVSGKPLPSASKRGRSQPKVASRGELVGSDG